MSLPIPEPKVWGDPSEIAVSRRLWGAVVLTAELEVCRSIICGRPVIARQLDAAALHRALRGERLPAPDRYFRVRAGHLDAVAEGGPFQTKASYR